MKSQRNMKFHGMHLAIAAVKHLCSESALHAEASRYLENRKHVAEAAKAASIEGESLMIQPNSGTACINPRLRLGNDCFSRCTIFRVATLTVFALAFLLSFAQDGSAASHPEDELLKYDATASDKAQKIYERKHKGLVSPTDISTQTQVSNLSKLQNGEMNVEAYLSLRALYETDVRILANKRTPPELIRKKVSIPLEDTYIKRLDFSPPLYKQRKTGGFCCNWYKY
ncbi:MAG: hypothetical protein ACE5FM_09685, partial [Methyloligellaceae bacterium]